MEFEFQNSDANGFQLCRMNWFPSVNKRPITFCKSLSPTCVLLSIFALYLICISNITHYVTKYHSKSLFNAHWNFLVKKFHGTFSKVPWNFLNNIWTTSVVPWNSMEFHGILSRSKVPWNSMELFTHSRVPWNSMEFHGTFNFPPKSSMEFHGIPWNFFWSSMEFHGIPWNLINFILKKNHISKYCFWYLIDD